jgi:hypothetical protein
MLRRRATRRAAATEGDGARCCDGGRRGEVLRRRATGRGEERGKGEREAGERGRQGRGTHLRWRATATTAAGGGSTAAGDRDAVGDFWSIWPWGTTATRLKSWNAYPGVLS